MQELGIIPDGDLFKMQQRAILEAKLAANNSAFKGNTNSEEQNHKNTSEVLHKQYKSKNYHSKDKNNSLSSLIPFDISKILNKFLKDFGIEEMLIIGLIVLLVLNEADLELILGLSFILLTGSL